MRVQRRRRCLTPNKIVTGGIKPENAGAYHLLMSYRSGFEPSEAVRSSKDKPARVPVACLTLRLRKAAESPPPLSGVCAGEVPSFVRSAEGFARALFGFGCIYFAP